jgi:hypothetical protein
MFPVYGGKCLPRTADHIWVEKFCEGRSNSLDDETEVRMRLKQHSKDFSSAGFDALLKRRDKCINVGGKYVEK